MLVLPRDPHVSIFQHAGAGAVPEARAIYLGPLVAGAVVVALMLKPLFARPPRGPRRRVLWTRGPSRSCTPSWTASATRSARGGRPDRGRLPGQRLGAPRWGLLGVLGGKLVLTIGLPFVAGVTLKQFAGVLAHEFGHFSQGAGMRLYALIMRINVWFARVVYQRDDWDETLDAWSSAITSSSSPGRRRPGWPSG